MALLRFRFADCPPLSPPGRLINPAASKTPRRRATERGEQPKTSASRLFDGHTHTRPAALRAFRLACSMRAAAASPTSTRKPRSRATRRASILNPDVDRSDIWATAGPDRAGPGPISRPRPFALGQHPRGVGKQSRRCPGEADPVAAHLFTPGDCPSGGASRPLDDLGLDAVAPGEGAADRRRAAGQGGFPLPLPVTGPG